jgi:transcriptional regulator with XRE-family HTH domain
MDTWAAELHARIAGVIKRCRGSRSANWLADRTAELGYPISRSQIANYESGRKKTLDIAELLIIAAALEVPPVALLYPNLPDGQVELLPGQSCRAITATRWFSGEDVPSSNDPTPTGGAELHALLRLSRMRYDLIFQETKQEAMIAERKERSEYKPEDEWPFHDHIRTIEEVIRRMPNASLVDTDDA